MSEEQNGNTTIDDTMKSGSEKSKTERIDKAKKKYEKSKKTLEKLKSVKALGPLIGVIGTILAVLVVIFLIIGFIGFFVTLPGLAMDKFLEACEEFWDRFTGNEIIEVENESIVDLAQYIEDMGYDIVGYGFATESSVTREADKKNGQKGDIIDINLDINEESNDETITNLNRITFMTSGSIKLMKEDGGAILPVDVLNDANIVKVTKDGTTNYYKAVDENNNNISFYTSDGNYYHYEIEFQNGQPVFKQVASGGYTIEDILDGKEISGYTITKQGISYKDFKTASDYYEKNGELEYYLNNVKTSCTLENQAEVITNILKAIKEYKIDANINEESNIRSIFIMIENECSIEISSIELYQKAEFLLNNYGESVGQQIINKLLSNSESDNWDKFMNICINATEEFMNNETEIKKNSAIKTPNLYTYILANERTYTAQGIKQNAAEWLIGWIPFIGDGIIDDFDMTEIKEAFPQRLGMIVFPSNTWDFSQGSVKKGNFSVTINREDNAMIIETGGFGIFGKKNQFKWSLEGWTSRYGKPIELSLALHLSTMAPDFVYNFCWDSDLQTLVTIKNKNITYHIDYSYITSKNKTVYRDDKEYENGEKVEGIITKYDKISSAIPTIQKGEKLFTTDIKLNEESGLIYPIDIFDKTSIISVSEDEGNTKVYYKAVDKDGKPITMFSNNGVNKYNIKFDSNNMPYFELTSEDNGYTTAEFFSTSNNKVSGTAWQDQYIDIDGKRITLEALSFSDLKIFINAYNVNDINSGLNGIDGFKKVTCGGHQLFAYVCYDVYMDTLNCLDEFINEIIKKDKYQAVCEKYNIELKLDLDNYKMNDNKLEKDGETYKYNSKENTDNEYQHKALETFKKIKDIDTSENNSQGISQTVEALSTFADWINGEVKQIEDENNRVYINIMLTQNIQEYLDENGMDANEFVTLYEVFKDLETEVTTYQPYIGKVTNHWYKDIYFEDDGTHNNGEPFTAYNEQQLSSQKYEYEPEGEAADENIEKLPGKIMIEQKPITEGIKQVKQPLIVKTEPWHYKVKNWIMYGYYFIYDGTTPTAKKIDRARSILTMYGYDANNPLLIDIEDNEQESLNISGTRAKEIEKKAEEYNEILKEAGSEIRLKRIDFEKKSSLQAFSILEAMHTEDAEYIYRDLKEFLIELGYFTRADFESIETDVFQWIVQGYTVYKDEWPDSKYEKNNSEYGTYIRSAVSLQKQREDEAEEAKEKNKNNDVNSTVSSVISNAETNYEAGYKVTTINGVAYRNYKQNDSRASYAKEPYWDGTIASDACGPTSACVLLSGYGIYMNPKEFIDKTEMTMTGLTQLYQALTKIGMSVKKYGTGSNNNEEHITRIEKALEAKKPVMVSVVGADGGAKDNKFTSYQHWMCLLGIESSGQLIISEVGNANIDVPTVTYSSVKDFVNDYMVSCGYIIPDNAPSGTTTTYEVVGFEAGLNIVAPESGVIKEIGTEEAEDEESEDEESDTNYFATNGKYVIIEFKTNNGVNGWKMKIEGLTVDADLVEGTTIKKGDTIGTTSTPTSATSYDNNIKIILYDEKDSIINNVEDYFKLKTRKKTSSSLEDIGKMYYIPYESADASCVGEQWADGEYGVGICQWTVRPDDPETIANDSLDAVTPFLEWLYEKDSEFCSEVRGFIGLTIEELIKDEQHNDLSEVFKRMGEQNYDYLLSLEVEYALQEKTDIANNGWPDDAKWMLNRSDIVVSTWFSLLNYGCGIDWIGKADVDDTMSDEEIIMRLCVAGAKLSNMQVNQETTRNRWESQAKAAIDILDGKLDAEEFALEGFEKYPQYGQGKNYGFFGSYY